MKSLDDDIRAVLEKNVDTIVDEPEKAEEALSIALRKQGIEPNLESSLSHATGFLTGLVEGMYIYKFKRHPNPEERDELLELLKRRAFEIRMAFMSTRMET